MNEVSIVLNNFKLSTSEIITTRLHYNKDTHISYLHVGTTCKDGLKQVDVYVNDKLVDILRNIGQYDSKRSKGLKTAFVRDIKLIMHYSSGATDIVFSKNYMDSIKRKLKAGK